MSEQNEGAFPASPGNPGQSESRTAYGLLAEVAEENDASWWDAYLALRQERKASGRRRWDWRRAVYIAWASMPAARRWPETQRELASEVLGLASDRVIRKWRQADPEIDNRIAKLTAAELLERRADVFHALVEVASMIDPRGYNDRRLFLELIGDYKAKGELALTGGDGGPVEILGGFDVSKLSDEELEQLLANLRAVEAAETDAPAAGGGEEGDE